MLIPSQMPSMVWYGPSLSRRVNANSQRDLLTTKNVTKLIKKGEC